MTDMYRPNQPRLHKQIYTDNVEWGAWRFYGGIPITVVHPATQQCMLHLETIEHFDISVIEEYTLGDNAPVDN